MSRRASCWRSLLVAAIFGPPIGSSRSPYVTRVDTFREQPVQFSHQHHVGGIGIDCRYCHTSVEKAASAGIPPTKTCMNCHSQIWANSPYLEPVRESFRDRQAAALDARARPARLRLLQPQRPREEGRRLRDLPRPRRPDAAAVPEVVAADGVVPRLPPQPRAATCGRARRCTRWTTSRPTNQLELGARLVKEYDIKSLTTCSTCHR